jgi:hypothetical protein
MSEISELFERDPLKLSEQDIATIVAKQREHQAQYELGVKAPAAPKPKTPRAAKATADLLKDLGLGPNPLDELGLK